jgi:hypothetical protein
MRPNCVDAWRFDATFVGLILLLTALVGRLNAQDDLSAAPSTLRDGETGIVLLQDGGVLAGQITRTANWYVVGRAGGQMQVPAARVMYVCRSLHEAYEYRIQHMSQPAAETHLTLAEWCLRYNLLEEAGRELQSARKLGASELRLGLVDRRLAAAKERPVQTASATSPAIAPAAAAEMSLPSSPAPDLPNGVLELFTRKVQPVLVNNCTASKCHQPGGKQSFQLNRALLRGEANRRSTMQNLSATLALIDRAHPEVSPLLTVPRQTHGGMTGPVFGPRQEQAFKHVAEWVAMVVPQHVVEPEPKVAEEIAANAPAAARIPKSVAPIPSGPTAYAQPTANEAAAVAVPVENADAQPAEDSAVEPAAAINDEALSSLRTPHRLQYGGSLESWRPRDPFDPEIFNRRQRAQSRPVPPPTQPAAQPAAPKKR